MSVGTYVTHLPWTFSDFKDVTLGIILHLSECNAPLQQYFKGSQKKNVLHHRAPQSKNTVAYMMADNRSQLVFFCLCLQYIRLIPPHWLSLLFGTF